MQQPYKCNVIISNGGFRCTKCDRKFDDKLPEKLDALVWRLEELRTQHKECK